MVEVLNSEAELTDRKNMMYTMKYNQEYDMDGSLEVLSDQPVNTTNEGEGSDQDPNMVKIRFSPIELNVLSTHLSMSLYYYDEESQEKTYITKIYHELDDGTVEELTTDSATGSMRMSRMYKESILRITLSRWTSIISIIRKHI